MEVFSLHAAVGLAVLEDIDQVIFHRQKIANNYYAFLSSRSELKLPLSTHGAPFQTYPVLIDSAKHTAHIYEYCHACGIEVRRYYRPALHQTTAFRKFPANNIQIASDISDRMLCLPVYSDMTQEEQNEVINVILNAIGDYQNVVFDECY